MPRRTSEKLKSLIDSPHAGKKQKIAAKPIDAKPASGLDAIGQAEWLRITEAYAASGRLTELDQTVLAMYCASFSRWKRAEQSLLNDGDVLWVKVRDTHGKMTHKKPITNPMTRVAESSARATHRFGDALGLSPAARTKQGFEHQKPENENEQNEFAEFES